MIAPSLGLYRALSRVRSLGYGGKIMLVAFIGSHVPLLALIAYFLIVGIDSTEEAMWLGGATFVATLVGSALMLLCLRHLLHPVTLASDALRRYVTERRLPDLPSGFEDEAGTLMADTDQALNRLDELLQQFEFSDAETGLPNRRRFHRYLGERLEDSGDTDLAICVLTLGGIVQVSSSLGAEVARQARRLTIRRIEAALGYRGGLSAIGDDMLAFVIEGADESATRERLDRVLGAGAGVVVADQRVDLDLTASLLTSPDPRRGPSQLVDDALSALRETAGGDVRVVRFTESGRDAIRDRYLLEQDLRDALDHDALCVHYQPFVDVERGCIAGVEALLRWTHGSRGEVPPLVFVPIAESCGLGERLGRWTLETVCRQVRRWQAAGTAPDRVSVNVSPRQLLDPGLIEHLETLLREYDIDRGRLEIEVTESTAMVDLEGSTALLGRIRALGIGTAIDDFGTGFSSMRYLANLPFDRLKIDRSFVRDAGSNSERLAICRALIALAEEMKLAIIAEGVEVAEELDALRAQGCREFQGFYFTEALPAAAISGLLRDPGPLLARSGMARRRDCRELPEPSDA